MEPEAEVVVFGILITDFDVFSCYPEVLFADCGVEIVVVEHHGWFYMTIEGDFVPVTMEKEPWAEADFLDGGVVAHADAAGYDAPGAILPDFLAGDGLPFGILGVFFTMEGVLYLDDEADVVGEHLCHLGMAEHDVTAFLVAEKFSVLAWLVDDAYRGQVFSADHGEDVGELCLGVHAVDDFLNLVEVLFGLGFVDGDGLLLSGGLDFFPDFLGGRDGEQVACLLIEFEI